MDYTEKLKELLELERNLESQLERIQETEEELSLKKTIYRQQLHFTRGQIALLENMLDKPVNPINPREYKNPIPMENLIKFQESPVMGPVIDGSKVSLDPFPVSPTSKPANIVGMNFV